MLDQAAISKAFLSSPGDDLVDKLIGQMQRVPQFVKLFGPAGDQGSWANYARFDWPIRKLPAVNIMESGAEAQSSTNGFLTGSVQIQVYWPPEFRRSDLSRVPAAFKGVMQNFFRSCYASTMLDEYYTVQRPEKVIGLNELGKTLTWSPNVEGLNDSELCPMTILDVQYRIDLRAWERNLEFEGRTTCDPFQVSLSDLDGYLGSLDGLNDVKQVKVTVPVDVDFNKEV